MTDQPSDRPGELVHYRVDDHVAALVLDSQHNRNALSRQLVQELYDGLARAEQDDDVKVVLVRAEGRSFCSGADMSEASQDGMEKGAEVLVALQRRIVTLPKPVVARVQGSVRAGGIGIVAAADIAVAAHDSTFAFTEVRLGVVPAVILVTVLPRLSPHAAHELLLTGETFDARRAVAVGLLNSAVPAEQLDAEVDRFTGMLIKGGPEALAMTKQLLCTRRISQDFAAMLELSAERFASAEGQEGIRAFAEKRPASWIPPG